jgi:glycerophosphoryl diester phosphodiesterase
MKMRIIAHRGASAEAPENTLAAFRRALELGVGMIELDVQLTADRVPVVIHDASLSRTTDGEGKVSSLRLADLGAISAGAWYHERYRSERIPTLAEVCQLVAGRAEINAEIKGSEGIAETARAAVQVSLQTGRLDSTLFSSFDPEALRSCRAESSHARLALLTGPGSLTPADAGSPSEPEAPVLNRLSRWSNLRLEAAHLHASLVTGRLVDALHREGLAVNVYTVDDPTSVRKLSGLGVDGVFTNDPGALLARWPAPERSGT